MGLALAALPGGLSASTDVFIKTYVASTGVATFSATAGGSELALSSDGTDGTTPFTIKFAEFQAVGAVREWSFEITRDEIDVTTIGQTLGQNAPFKTYITGFADGEGSATIYTTDDDTTIASRLVEDVIQRIQTGVQFKLYIDRVISSGTVNDTASRSITMEAVLTSASYSVNPDDAQQIEIAFRPSAVPTFDLSESDLDHGLRSLGLCWGIFYAKIATSRENLSAFIFIARQATGRQQ